MATAPEPTGHVVTAPWAQGLRPPGAAPYWSPGDAVWWHYRRRDWQPGDPVTR